MRKATEKQMTKFTKQIETTISTMTFLVAKTDYDLATKKNRLDAHYTTMQSAIWGLYNFNLISLEQKTLLVDTLFNAYWDLVYPIEEQIHLQTKQL